jgi:2-aminobenzoate-CoA ligase
MTNAPLTSRRSAHTDSFCRDRLPPPEALPNTVLNGAPGLDFPAQLNCAAELLDKVVAAGRGECTVFHCNGERWSYRQLLQTANQIAHVLVEDLKLEPGNRVLLRSPNNPMLAACWFAVLKAGGVCVATMPLLRVRELQQIIEQAQISIALTDHRVAGDCELAMQSRSKARVLNFGLDLPGSLERAMGTKPKHFDSCLTDAEDVAIIAFTSGTTGKSKGTMHFHRDIMAACVCFPQHVLHATPDDVFCGSPPLAFTYALGGLLLFPMSIGASTLLIEQPTPANLILAIERERPTICFTSPTGYRAMLAQAGEHDLSSLRKCVSAGEHLPAATFEAWRKATGLRIIDGIGSTELLHMFIASPEDEVRPGSTGKVVPGYQARIVDEAGRELPPGSVGRLAVCGPTGCKYLDNPEQQRHYVQQGWNFTGDSYVADSDGYFWYQARTDDMIISSGYNISAPEVENALLEHPAVAECAVIGVPDDARGQLVKAFVVVEPGISGGEALTKELQQHVKSVIAPYKYPRAIEFVSSLPRTMTGKLQRFLLRTGHEGDPMKLRASSDRENENKNAEVAFIEPPGWKQSVGYSQCIAARGRVMTLAGQIGWDPSTCQFESDDFAQQTAQALRNVVAILRAGGAEPQHLTRLTWYVTNREEYLDARRETGRHYREIIGRHYPPMSVVIVAGLLEARAKVEIEATAVVPD